MAGAVPERDLRDIGAVTLGVGQVNTVLYGIQDQSALYGLLARLRALGVEVIEVRRIPSPSSEIEVPGATNRAEHDDASD